MRKMFFILILAFFVVGCGGAVTNRIERTDYTTLSDSSDSITSKSTSISSASDYNYAYSISIDSGSISVSDDPSQEDPAEPLDTRQLWEIQLEEKIERLSSLKEQSSENETFCFFTDPHYFMPSRDYNVDVDVINNGLQRLKTAYDLSSSSFIICGGDLLNNADTISQACYKLSCFMALYNSSFENPHFIVGNHDTNYQGDTYIDYMDFNSCMLSQDTINDIFFNGEKAYYCIDTPLTSYYCFDSGIDWNDSVVTPYRWEQIDWFADALLHDEKPHKAIFIHMAFSSSAKKIAMFQKIETIVEAYNYKRRIEINGKQYNYTNTVGNVHFVQAGHLHRDFERELSNGVPVFFTRTFGSPEVATQPTFDIVFVDYANRKIVFLRIGDGDDREFYLPYIS